jgi:hypothetical protein
LQITKCSSIMYMWNIIMLKKNIVKAGKNGHRIYMRFPSRNQNFCDNSEYGLNTFSWQYTVFVTTVIDTCYMYTNLWKIWTKNVSANVAHVICSGKHLSTLKLVRVSIILYDIFGSCNQLKWPTWTNVRWINWSSTKLKFVHTFL